MNWHHTTLTTIEGADFCSICNRAFLIYWEDKDQTKGRSDTTTVKDGKVVHYACTGGKSLKQLNEERRRLK